MNKEYNFFFFTFIRSYAALQAADLDLVAPGYSLVGTLWGVLNVSLRASSTRIGPDLLCHISSVVHRPSSVTNGGFQPTGSDDFCHLRGSQLSF